mmetsp:Transcript_38243/g.108107  ORF Transcript_38243/g.108107 Transcript_38243/m.108107 type:complete len:162 (-) Transcript_38243:52-537(-)
MFQEDQKQPVQKKRKGKIDLETLERCGYKSGPSVLLMPDSKPAGQSEWAWGSGGSQKQLEPEQESSQDRLANQEAASSGVAESAAISKRSMLLKDQYYQARRSEKEEAMDRAFGGKKDKDNKSFNQKEKRKRDSGQASRGKNFVEEEKRMGREFGLYSGFD